SRGRAGSRLVGSTALRLLGRLDCSLLTIKPDDFVCPVAPERCPTLEAQAGQHREVRAPQRRARVVDEPRVGRENLVLSTQARSAASQLVRRVAVRDRRRGSDGRVPGSATTALRSFSNSCSVASTRSWRSGNLSQSELKPKQRPPA